MLDDGVVEATFDDGTVLLSNDVGRLLFGVVRVAGFEMVGLDVVNGVIAFRMAKGMVKASSKGAFSS